MVVFWICLAIFLIWLAQRYVFVSVKKDVEPPKVQGRSFNTKVVGVTFANPDGAQRQAIIKKHCAPGNTLDLVPEPNNPKDHDAVGVWVKGQQIGYIPSGRTARDLARYITDGTLQRVSVASVTGGSANQPTLGVNILVELTNS